MPLIKIDPCKYDLKLHIAYATEDNFIGKKLYKNPFCYLHKDAVKCLQKTIELASNIDLQVKIFDAFRPLEVQELLWEKYPNPEFVSNPKTGRAPHCRGIAIDMTLIENNGKELDMGTGFDAFTPLSHHSNTNISAKSQKNRHILMGIMTASGWEFNPNEWWHYQLPDPSKYKKFTDKEAQTNML